MIYMSTTRRPSWLRGNPTVVKKTGTGTTPTAIIDDESKLESSQKNIKIAAFAGGIFGLFVGIFIVWLFWIFGFNMERMTTWLSTFGGMIWIAVALGIAASAYMVGYRIAGEHYAKSRDIPDTHDHSSTDAPSNSH
jgi:hypothetical protein